MILRKAMVFLLMFAILVVLNYVLDVIKAYRLGTNEKRLLRSKLVLGVAISYILTIIFTGISL